MKKIFSLILAFTAIALPMSTQASDDKPSSTPTPIILESILIDPRPNPKPHRAPMHICVDAYYDALSGTISIIYDGEAEGEVNLYLEGALVETSSEINTTFSVSESGFYTIEIISEYWAATGSIEI